LLARGADPLRAHNGIPVVVEAEIRGHWLAAEIMKGWTTRGNEPTAEPQEAGASPSPRPRNSAVSRTCRT
jgi:hypothetical protein